MELEHIFLSKNGDALVILDQTLLPNEVRYLELRSPGEMFEAILTLRVRGAPAIGIFAGYALYVLALAAPDMAYTAFSAYISRQAEYLASSRPTAVNLSRMARRMVSLVRDSAALAVPQIISLMRIEADRIRDEDIAMCRAISEHGLALIRDGSGILTHCNAGPLATSRYGTGLGPIFLARERGIDLRVYCDETRPLLQGARLTAYELQRAGIDCTLICDNMASIVMREGLVDACFVGCDRVARNGDTANKIGTSGVAILAKHYGIPFYVFCPSSTIDPGCRTGADIELEQRAPDEIRSLHYVRPMAPEGVKCYNPAFDVTDAELITAIVTERGICRAPYGESLRKVVG